MKEVKVSLSKLFFLILGNQSIFFGMLKLRDRDISILFNVLKVAEAKTGCSWDVKLKFWKGMDGEVWKLWRLTLFDLLTCAHIILKTINITKNKTELQEVFRFSW